MIKPLLFSYLQKAGELHYTPSKALAFWFDQTHLVHVNSEKPLGLAAVFTDYHAGYEVTVIWKSRKKKKRYKCKCSASYYRSRSRYLWSHKRCQTHWKHGIFCLHKYNYPEPCQMVGGVTLLSTGSSDREHLWFAHSNVTDRTHPITDTQILRYSDRYSSNHPPNII